MKISKVDHRRSAVAISNAENIEGFLYKSPGKQINAKESIDDVIKKASILYSVFKADELNEISKNHKDKKDLIKTIKSNFDLYTKKAITVNDLDLENKKVVVKNYKQILSDEYCAEENKVKQKGKQIEIRIAKLEEQLEIVKDKNKRNNIERDLKKEKNNQRKNVNKVKRFTEIKKPSDADTIINEICTKAITRKINRTVGGYALSDVIKELINAVCFEYSSDEIRNIDNNKLFCLYTEIIKDRDKINYRLSIEDRTKKDPKSLIEFSLKNQTTKVKSYEDILLPPYASSKKSYLFKFLKEYADADSEEKKVIQKDINKIIYTFIVGEIPDDKSCGAIGCSTQINNKPSFIQTNKDKILSLEDSKKYDKDAVNNIQKEVRDQIVAHFSNAKKLLVDNETNKFWLNYFSLTLEKLLSDIKNIRKEKVTNEYLFKYLRKEYFSYIANKYIEMGKGLYHFSLPNFYKVQADLNKGKEVNLDLMRINKEEYKRDITSFDYERIKAKEKLERNIATSATFAYSTFANSIVRKDDLVNADESKIQDIYSQRIDKNNKSIRDDAFKRVLRYFGGASKWDFDDSIDKYFVMEQIKRHISYIRNGYYHYTAVKTEVTVKENNPIRSKLFENEFLSLNEVYLKKYYSNNVPAYFEIDDVLKLMNNLYSKKAPRESQIPSFNTVLKRTDMKDFLSNNLIIKDEKEIKDEKLQNSIYYVLKEIYYYSFLQDDNLKQLFINEYDNYRAQGKEATAWKNFKDRIDSVKNEDFDVICQTIMTDLNLQNQIKSSKDKVEKIYQHYPILLRKIICKAFISYLNKDQYSVFAFIKNPLPYNNGLDLETFLSYSNQLHIKTFDELKELVDDSNEDLLDWYIMAKFLTSKQLNLLIGDFRNYIQFINDIDSRSKALNNHVNEEETKSEEEKYKKIVSILEFSLQFIGQTSNNLEDYFNSKDEYAKHIARFVDFGGESFEKLREFEDLNKINIYSDDKNAIANGKIIYSDMYSNPAIIETSFTKKINKDEISKYKQIKENLKDDLFKRNIYKNQKEIDSIREFTNTKNRVELLDISTYTDIISDYMSQLVTWSYLRERDLMYFQLGINYFKLLNNNNLPKEYNKLDYKNLHISNGAILYEVASLYTHVLPFYVIDKNSEWALPTTYNKYTNTIEPVTRGTLGIKTRWFKDEDKFNKSPYNKEIFDNGMNLFGKDDQRQRASSFRNRIDHMRYIYKQEESIMEMFTNIYNDYFVYSPNFRKSVSYIFGNILDKYNITAYTEMIHSENSEDNKFKMLIKKDEKGNNGNIRYGLTSNKFTYKFKGSNGKDAEYKVNAKTRDFINQVRAILEYKEENK